MKQNQSFSKIASIPFVSFPRISIRPYFAPTLPHIQKRVHYTFKLAPEYFRCPCDIKQTMLTALAGWLQTDIFSTQNQTILANKPIKVIIVTSSLPTGYYGRLQSRPLSQDKSKERYHSTSVVHSNWKCFKVTQIWCQYITLIISFEKSCAKNELISQRAVLFSLTCGGRYWQYYY